MCAVCSCWALPQITTRRLKNQRSLVGESFCCSICCVLHFITTTQSKVVNFDLASLSELIVGVCACMCVHVLIMCVHVYYIHACVHVLIMCVHVCACLLCTCMCACVNYVCARVNYVRTRVNYVCASVHVLIMCCTC